MKKTILVTALLSIMCFSAQAQLLKLGIKAGLNYANETGSSIKTTKISDYSQEASTGYHAGLVAQIGLSKGISFQPELLYTSQGSKYESLVSSVADINNELGYISIPAILKIDLSKTFSLELGPQASFLLSSKDNVNLNDANTFDFSVVGGLGINITKSIFVQARYGLGLTEISANADAKNSVVQVSAGIFF
jgi:opacity protein-like surface antigen